MVTILQYTANSACSTTVISVIRLQSLVQFATSTNPTYDNVPTAYWSVLEAFVGIFCICMPALRRFLSHIFPQCFGSTQSNSKYENYDTPSTPNKLSGSKSKGSKASRSFGIATFGGTGITKTTETRVESSGGSDDEINLMDMNKDAASKIGWTVTEVDAASERTATAGTTHANFLP